MKKKKVHTCKWFFTSKLLKGINPPAVLSYSCVRWLKIGMYDERNGNKKKKLHCRSSGEKKPLSLSQQMALSDLTGDSPPGAVFSAESDPAITVSTKCKIKVCRNVSVNLLKESQIRQAKNKGDTKVAIASGGKKNADHRYCGSSKSQDGRREEKSRKCQRWPQCLAFVSKCRDCMCTKSVKCISTSTMTSPETSDLKKVSQTVSLSSFNSVSLGKMVWENASYQQCTELGNNSASNVKWRQWGLKLNH